MAAPSFCVHYIDIILGRKMPGGVFIDIIRLLQKRCNEQNTCGSYAAYKLSITIDIIRPL